MQSKVSAKQIVMALLAAMLFIAVPMVVAAQDDNAQMQVLEFKGVVEAIDATTATVSSLVFDISRAELDDDGPILVGAMVEVDFVMLEGARVALEVYLERDDNNGFDAQLEGLLEAIGEGTITVNGLTIDTTQAVFEDGIEVNTVVEVYYSYVEGVLVAVRVESAEDDGSDDDNDNDRFEDYYFYGVLESLTATEAIVNGVTFDASRAILDDDVAVGVAVKVEYVIIEGVFVATEIETDDDSNVNDNDDDRFEDYYHYGVLESLTATQAIVSGVTFDASRAILDDDVAVGVAVKVEYLIIEGVFVATEIETDDDSNDDSNGNDDDDDSSNDDDGVCVVEQPDDWTTYTVKAGDTLSAIALATDTDLDDLIEVNCIENPRAVAVGTILYVEEEADFSDISNEDDDNSGDDDDSNNDDDDNGDDNGGDDNGDDNGDDDNGDDNGDDDDGDDDDGDDDDGDDEEEGDDD